MHKSKLLQPTCLIAASMMKTSIRSPREPLSLWPVFKLGPCPPIFSLCLNCACSNQDAVDTAAAAAACHMYVSLQVCRFLPCPLSSAMLYGNCACSKRMLVPLLPLLLPLVV